ncbi:MAG: hypothetical protein JWR89_3452 [Tardiphaga sp.]|jgi:hypothetical protein|uniref:hypothetical protein n=1 Tax=Tardiphaga sp. TaxID=1926292 RepID=UPI002619FE2C|nr:hypothetical protein [Tardiphaga sp.]MDB5503550.1 hypothetical protein [Tardiphaga sp.]
MEGLLYHQSIERLQRDLLVSRHRAKLLGLGRLTNLVDMALTNLSDNTAVSTTGTATMPASLHDRLEYRVLFIGRDGLLKRSFPLIADDDEAARCEAYSLIFGFEVQLWHSERKVCRLNYRQPSEAEPVKPVEAATTEH